MKYRITLRGTGIELRGTIEGDDLDLAEFAERVRPFGVVVASQAMPIDSHCPACNAAPGAPCTQPTDDSRRPVGWTHSVRGES